MLDQNDDGRIDYKEFLDIVSGRIFQIRNEADVKRFFRAFDSTNSGYITRNDLRDLIGVIGREIDERELDETIREVDINGDGKINYKGNLIYKT